MKKIVLGLVTAGLLTSVMAGAVVDQRAKAAKDAAYKSAVVAQKAATDKAALAKAQKYAADKDALAKAQKARR